MLSVWGLDSVQGIWTLARPEVAHCQKNVNLFIGSCVGAGPWAEAPGAGGGRVVPRGPAVAAV